MKGRIFTARHGRPDVDRTVQITAKEYGQWWADYDLAGLAADQTPPASLIQVAAQCDQVVSSTLPRAIETAAWLVDGKREVPQDPIYVEAPLPAPPVPFLKMDPLSWGRVSRSFWFLGYAPGGIENHAQTHRRVKEVAARLISLVEGGQDVLLCAHGYLNWMLDRRLQREGWRKIAHDRGNDYWSWRAYGAKDEPRRKALDPVAPPVATAASAAAPASAPEPSNRRTAAE